MSPAPQMRDAHECNDHALIEWSGLLVAIDLLIADQVEARISQMAEASEGADQ